MPGPAQQPSRPRFRKRQARMPGANPGTPDGRVVARRRSSPRQWTAKPNQPALVAPIRRGRREPGTPVVGVVGAGDASLRNGVAGRYSSVRSEKCRAPERTRSTEKNEWNHARIPSTGLASATCSASARVRAAWWRSARIRWRRAGRAAFNAALVSRVFSRVCMVSAGPGSKASRVECVRRSSNRARSKQDVRLPANGLANTGGRRRRRATRHPRARPTGRPFGTDRDEQRLQTTCDAGYTRFMTARSRVIPARARFRRTRSLPLTPLRCWAPHARAVRGVRSQIVKRRFR